MALLGRKFQNVVGGGLVGLSALTSSAMAQSASGTLESLPSTPITTLASANSNTVKSGESSLTERANTAASERRISKTERNEMAAEMEIASGDHADTSYAYLMDNDSTGTGLYRLWLPERTDDMPADVVQQEIDRLRKNAIVYVVFYSKGEDPYDQKKYSDDQRRFGRTMSKVTAQLSDTPVVLLELPAYDENGVQFYEEMDAITEKNTWAKDGSGAFDTLDELLVEGVERYHMHLVGGALYVPNQDIHQPFFHQMYGDNLDERNETGFRVLGTVVNQYDRSFANYEERLASSPDKGSDLALNNR